MGVSANYRMREVTIPALPNNSLLILNAISDFLTTAPLNWTEETNSSQLLFSTNKTLVMSSLGESGSDFIFFRLQASLDGFRIKTGLHYSRSLSVETIINDTGYAHDIGKDSLGNATVAIQLNTDFTCKFYADRDFFMMSMKPTGATQGYLLYAGRLDSFYQGTMTTLTAPVLATDTALPVADEAPFDAVGYPSNYFVMDPSATGALKKVRVISSAPGVLNLNAAVGFAFQTGSQVGEDVQPIFAGVIQEPAFGTMTMANDMEVGFQLDPAIRRSIALGGKDLVSGFNQLRNPDHWPIWPTTVRQSGGVGDHRGGFKGMWFTIGSSLNLSVGPTLLVPDPADYNGDVYDYAESVSMNNPRFYLLQGAVI